MKTRKPKRKPIKVVDRCQHPASLAARLYKATNRLLAVDRERFRVVMELAETYVAAFDHPDESAAEFNARLMRLQVGHTTTESN